MFNGVKNQWLILLFAAIMIVFTGCGGSQNANGNAPAAATASSESASEQSHQPEESQKPAETVELTISSAASMTDALADIQKLYEAHHSGIKLNFNFGASGALQQQIEQGAPADLFLSAAVKNMTALVDEGLVDSGQQTNLLKNELVVVAAADSAALIQKVEDLSNAEVKTIAIGIPESVPAGNYTKEALTALNLWDTLQSKSVQAKDVRQVLQYVETGNADAGFVYKTDALSSDKVKIAFVVDPSTYKSIQYPIGIVKATKHAKEAEDFYAYLQTQEALDVFVKYGFSVAE